MKGLRILLLGLAICLASGVKAQIYNSEALFYLAPEYKLTNPQATVYVMRFKNGVLYHYRNGFGENLIDVSNNIKNNDNYYENKTSEWKEGDVGTTKKYDSSMSNEKWVVYSHYNAYIPGFGEMPAIVAHTDYWAHKKDLSQYMTWSEPIYVFPNGSECGHRRTLNRITKEDLKKMTFTGARDFLQ